MPAIKTYRDLIVWNKAMELVMEVYTLTNQYPREELYGLTAQVRKAVVSIPSNIAEGFGRASPGDFSRFLTIATASLFEVQTQLEIGYRLAFCTEESFRSVFDKSREVERLLTRLTQRLKARTITS